ncbi:hypothetical protein Poli38472_004156 [Pythium oligandrum]|uniref:Transmembrane protein 138 n=1 Tax=Pythium oligandrum TaxID=41045 RepID=A0A8K1FKT1_PYTOL|nr:hypothetical protein Poli38472_004156 [Pythium oligandrum]|eukprot:TMW66391.1 hypothetical protein Poli38472_004156 [Pythium oligandrum]
MPSRHGNPLFAYHSALFWGLCIVDIVLNASVEFADLPGQEKTDSSNSTILIIVQVLLQIFGFINFFALLGATFLFRSGLFSLIYRHFRATLLIQPAYICITTVLGAVRVSKLQSGHSLLDVWDSDGYQTLSCIQKLAAVFYYFSCIDGIEKLRHPKYYDQDYWLFR